MNRRRFLRSGVAGLTGALGLATAKDAMAAGLGEPSAHAEAVARSESLEYNPKIVAAGLPGGPQIPGGRFRPTPGKRLDGGPGFDVPGNVFNGAFRMGHDISPTYTYRDIPDESEVDYKKFPIDIVIAEHELLDGVRFHFLAFNGQVPGPAIRVNRGDWVKVVFTNKTQLMHTIHWHGLFSPYEMDGVPFMTQPPLMPGQQFVYKFRAEPPGTHMYHCHFSTPLHQAHAMHGAFVIEDPDDPVKKMFPYTREYILVLESFASDFLRTGLNAMLERMKQRIWLFKHKLMNRETAAVFDNYTQLKKYIARGYLPPYSQARNQVGLVEPNWNFFAINGKCYPATEPVRIRPGEWIRIRMVNGGFLDHYMHLHGHDFYHVANDGAPLPHPVRGNTLPIAPGKTADIVVYGNNPGVWAFHDHNTFRATNNGVYPGGILTALEYEGFVGGYTPVVAVDE